MDRVSRSKRSAIMSRVRSTGNVSTERRLRCALMRAKLRGWRMHMKEVPGCPDFIFEADKVAVFVDGCFWHGCPQCHRRPKSNRKYWSNKIDSNILRDKRINGILIEQGWKVLRFWEHSLHDLDEITERISSETIQTKNPCPKCPNSASEVGV
ncbi:DNA mismatch endonuclease Vsr [Candidatus Acetothermia bacterium]|nr:DNA mismatch endonuclease Vsr [Candidatus Acetothermia bacterium]MBI3644174.1 DNA mismatch endonuclease Vsr [Candidatus Acetothermia bacterium]